MKIERLFLGAVLVAPLALVTGSAKAEAPSHIDSFAECISREHNLDVLFLVDESKSLKELKEGGQKKPGNDPGDARVAALKSVVSVLESSLSATRNSSDATDESDLKVNIAVAGFGDQYRKRMDFESLTDQSIVDINAALDQQADQDSDLHTRYHVALDGSLKTFQGHSKGDSCRLLMWFSDGQHDDDNSAGFNKQERNQIQSVVCGPSGLVDQLRTEGVYIVAAGLNKNPKQLGLMKMIAAGGDPYISNGFGEKGSPSVNVRKCGETEPFGTFETASDAEKIVDSIFRALRNVPGVPNRGVKLGEVPGSACKPEDGQVCEGFWFRADDSIQSFNMLLSRPNPEVDVEIVMPGGSKRAVMEEDGKSDLIVVTPVTRNKALVSAHSSKTNSLAGDWYVSFRGANVEGSTGYVSFVGSAEVSLESPAPTNSIRQVNRNGATDFVVRVESNDKLSSVEQIDAKFVSGDAEVPVKAVRSATNDGTFVLQKGDLEAALKSGGLEQASSVTLEVKPIGTIEGLTVLDDEGTNGSDNLVRAEYKSKQFDLAVRNGASFPVCFNYDGASLRFKGTPQVPLKVKCQGPDAGSGTVEFAGVEKNPGDFELISPAVCTLGAHETKECDLTLKPNTDTFQRASLAVNVVYKDSAGKSQNAKVDIPFASEKPTDPGKGIVAALELVFLFLLIQGLVRLGFSFLLSRFAPLSSTAERVRFEATVSGEGMVQLNPRRITPSASDKGFATENSTPTPQFSVFGYTFRCSPLRTFLRSTTRPVGYVEKSGYVVLGPAGNKAAKKDAFPVVGMVDLALSGQWVLGIPETAVTELANGAASVDGEVVAFLAPLTQIDLETQEANLGLEIAASRVMSDIAGLVERVRVIRDAGVDVEVDETAGERRDGGGASTPDPFGDFALSPSVMAEEETVRARSRKERGKRKKGTESSEESIGESSEPPQIDRFA